MLKQMSSMMQYISWLIEKQKELQRHSSFKIIDIKTNKSGDATLTIQVTNKATIFQCTPSEIITNDRILEEFSKQDIRIITYYATHDAMKPKTQIVSHRFSEGIKKFLCKIRNVKTNAFEEKSISDISSKEFINNLNQEDAHRLGYLKAMEESIQEQSFFNGINKADKKR